MAGGKQREIGLGPARGTHAVTLAKAREQAAALARQVADKLDPLAEREAQAEAKKQEAKAEAIRATTFKEVAEEYVTAHEAGWDNAKHKAQWRSTLTTYAYPHMGAVPIADVDTDHVLQALTPIWQTKPETAKRVRGRIEAVLIAATVKGLRSGANPAQWRGHLAELLPARSKVAPVEHHAALPFAELPAFFLRLQAADGLGARALELAILTAARTGEILGATWAELDPRRRPMDHPARPHEGPARTSGAALRPGGGPAAQAGNGAGGPACLCRATRHQNPFKYGAAYVPAPHEARRPNRPRVSQHL